jgi:hypothetical protein
MAQDFVISIDNKLNEYQTEDEKSAFLDHMYYNFGGIMAALANACGRGYDSKKQQLQNRIPKWLDNIDNPGWPIFDHFSKITIYPSEKILVEKPFLKPVTKYSCHPYGADGLKLAQYILKLHEAGIETDISGESEYFPGHTFELRFHPSKGSMEEEEEGPTATADDDDYDDEL